MSLLTELLGNDDDAAWMSTPGRNCALPDAHMHTPKEIGQYADMWFQSGSRFARRLCNGCPVKTECLDYAIPDPTLEGVWGGLTTRERAKLRSKRAAA